jgi:DNA-binding transcriptional MerR regulator
MSARDYLTIGEVVRRLEGSYPNLSISKIRFLEEEGLVTPERTAGGYRKFSPSDVQRVDMILKLQRDHFLPLAVIREKLVDFDRGRVPAEFARGLGTVAEPLVVSEDDTPVPVDEVQSALGIPVSFVRELMEFGLVVPSVEDGREVLPRADVLIVHAAWDLRRFGIEPRHLRMYETFAERESAFFQQILMPAFRHKTADTKTKLGETLGELGDMTDELKNRLLQRALGRVFEDLG